MCKLTCRLCRFEFEPIVANLSVTPSRPFCYECFPVDVDASCLACGSTFRVSKLGHCVCSATCRKRLHALHKIGVVDCQVCGETHTLHGRKLNWFNRDGVFTCSDECRAEHRRKRTREYQRATYGERTRALSRKNTAIRRARMMGAGRVDNFRHEVVFERDGWRCHICRKKVLRSKVTPHPRSPSLDHLVPLAKGGTHTLDNVACACLGCNIRKKDRAVGEQLRLIG